MPRIEDEQLKGLIGHWSDASGITSEALRELLAYRESGALEALRGAYEVIDRENTDTLHVVEAAIIKLEAIQK